MDVRGPRLRKPSDEALAFTSSMASDARIARHVIRVNIAHMAALVRTREVDRATGAKCIRFLMDAHEAKRVNAEDFHQQLEQDAVDALGVDTAGFLNYGKSRNDQVATAIRMELREAVLQLADAVGGLQEALLKSAKKNGAALVPGYTHLQRAQPITLAHYSFAHFDALQRDVERLFQLYERVNLSPMGSAALAGTDVKIDRRFVADCLGFASVLRNAMDAVSSRDFAVEALSCATLTMLDASRLSEEQLLWSSREFGFLELDDAYSASSSIMPQKKNAVVAETVRAKAGSVLGDLVAACAILKALPYAYNLDLQEVTPHLWSGIDAAATSIRTLAGSVASASFNLPRLRGSMQDDGSTATALANYLVKKHRVSFRTAHSIVGELVRLSIKKRIPLAEAAASSLGQASAKYGMRLEIDLRTMAEVLDPKNFLMDIVTEGGSSPRTIGAELISRSKQSSKNRATLSALRSSLAASEKRLLRIASELVTEVKPRVER